MKSPLFDFGTPEPDRRPIRIRTTRSMLLRVLDGTMQHTSSGSTITIPGETLAGLDGTDYEIVGIETPGIEDHQD